MKYIGLEYTETFYHCFAADDFVTDELIRRKKFVEKQYPDLEFYEARREYMDVPQEIDSELGKVVMNRGHFITVVFRKKKVVVQKNFIDELKELIKKYDK